MLHDSCMQRQGAQGHRVAHAVLPQLPRVLQCLKELCIYHFVDAALYMLSTVASSNDTLGPYAAGDSCKQNSAAQHSKYNLFTELLMPRS